MQGQGRLARMQQVSNSIAQALGSREGSDELSKVLRAQFPQAGYISVTSVVGRGANMQLFEYYNLLEPVPLSRDAYFTAATSVAAEAIASNQNKYYDETVHRTKLAAMRDFQRAAGDQDCGSIVCVPLPCHSRLVPPGVQGTVVLGGVMHCSHCHRRMETCGRPLGCVTLGIRRNIHFSIREYLAKMLVLAGLLGPRLLAPSPAVGVSAAQAAGSAAATTAAALAGTQSSNGVNMALQSSWYTPSPAPAAPSLAPASAAMVALADNVRRLSLDSNGQFAGLHPQLQALLAASVSDAPHDAPHHAAPHHDALLLGVNGRMSLDSSSLDTLLRVPANGRMSLDSQASCLSSVQLGGNGCGSSRGNSLDLPPLDRRLFNGSLLGPVASGPALHVAQTQGLAQPFPGMSLPPVSSSGRYSMEKQRYSEEGMQLHGGYGLGFGGRIPEHSEPEPYSHPTGAVSMELLMAMYGVSNGRGSVASNGL